MAHGETSDSRRVKGVRDRSGVAVSKCVVTCTPPRTHVDTVPAAYLYVGKQEQKEETEGNEGRAVRHKRPSGVQLRG